MVFIISVAQQKGGAGKTTLAAHLAVAFREKYRVGLIDGDPQASLACWFRERKQQHPDKIRNMTFSQVPGWRVTSEISRMRLDNDVIIIDNGSGLDMDTRTTMRHADLTVVPVQPSPADIWATEAVIDFAEKERYPVLLVMNRVTARSRLASLFSSSLPFLSNTLIGNRIAFASVLQEGLTVMEDAPHSQAAKEIQNLVKEVTKYMPKKGKPAKQKASKKELEKA